MNIQTNETRPASSAKGLVLTVASLSLLLSACGGVAESPSPDVAGSRAPDAFANSACVGSLAGGGTQVSAVPCATCKIDGAPQAIDGLAETFASIDFDRPVVLGMHQGGTSTLRASAQNGIVFPAGNMAGALISVFRGNASRLAIRTYLGSQPQESASMPIDPSDAPLHVFQTKQAFDAVEVQVIDLSPDNGAEFRIYEFCANA